MMTIAIIRIIINYMEIIMIIMVMIFMIICLIKMPMLTSNILKNILV